MKEALIKLIAGLEGQYKHESNFYNAYMGLDDNDGDISNWCNNHFEDSVEMGFGVGERSATFDIIEQLKQIVGEHA